MKTPSLSECTANSEFAIWLLSQKQVCWGIQLLGYVCGHLRNSCRLLWQLHGRFPPPPVEQACRTHVGADDTTANSACHKRLDGHLCNAMPTYCGCRDLWQRPDRVSHQEFRCQWRHVFCCTVQAAKELGTVCNVRHQVRQANRSA